eukprot:gene8058-9605_t
MRSNTTSDEVFNNILTTVLTEKVVGLKLDRSTVDRMVEFLTSTTEEQTLDFQQAKINLRKEYVDHAFTENQRKVIDDLANLEVNRTTCDDQIDFALYYEKYVKMMLKYHFASNNRSRYAVKMVTVRLYEEVWKSIRDSCGSGIASTSPLDATKSSATTLQSTTFTATITATNEAVTPRVLWDLYCGVGTIGLNLANTPFISQVIGVESVHEAVLDARENAQLNNITNIQFIQGLAEEIILSNGFTPGATEATVNAGNPSSQPNITLPALQRNDIVILNPPRKGCHVSLLSALKQSKVRTIVYISCNPKTMARDMKILTSPHPTKAGNAQKKKSNAAKGELECVYEIKRIQPVDMFPQTTHIETVVWLERETSHK